MNSYLSLPTPRHYSRHFVIISTFISATQSNDRPKGALQGKHVAAAAGVRAHAVMNVLFSRPLLGSGS